jgi:hypothetical protein
LEALEPRYSTACNVQMTTRWAYITNVTDATAEASVILLISNFIRNKTLSIYYGIPLDCSRYFIFGVSVDNSKGNIGKFFQLARIFRPTIKKRV